MRVKKQRKRIVRAFIVRDQAGHIIETTSLIYSDRKHAEAIARELFCRDGLRADVHEIYYEYPNPQGRKPDDKTLGAWREFEFSRPDKKKHSTKLFRELTERYFGPFEKNVKGRLRLRKKSDSLERSIRRLQALHKPQKVKKHRKK